MGWTGHGMIMWSGALGNLMRLLSKTELESRIEVMAKGGLDLSVLD
jgi:hypothetical protein